MSAFPPNENLRPGENLRQVYRQLSTPGRFDGKGSIYVFTSPKTGAGTSFVARNMAMIAAHEIGQGANAGAHVLLLDMDLQNNAQSNYFSSPEAQAQYGAAQGPYDATFGSVPFWRVTPSMVNDQGQSVSDSAFMSLHLLPHAGISFSKFHWENFRPGQNVHIQNARPFWHALRDHFAAVIVDTPALDRADILSTVSMEADQTILVAPGSAARDPELSAAYQRVNNLGASCAGVIFNDGPTGAPAQGAL
jgi:Mrp family chromosome partitioning ATPase